jgi:hypothetical protein
MPAKPCLRTPWGVCAVPSRLLRAYLRVVAAANPALSEVRLICKEQLVSGERQGRAASCGARRAWGGA